MYLDKQGNNCGSSIVASRLSYGSLHNDGEITYTLMGIEKLIKQSFCYCQ